MHTLRHFVLAVLLMTSIKGNCQNSKKDPADMVVQQIAMHNIYEVSSSVGFTGKLSIQYQHFERLSFLASNEQLLHYARNHLNRSQTLLFPTTQKKENIPYLKM